MTPIDEVLKSEDLAELENHHQDRDAEVMRLRGEMKTIQLQKLEPIRNAIEREKLQAAIRAGRNPQVLNISGVGVGGKH